jgi:regulator of telomere elongation helicase 1
MREGNNKTSDHMLLIKRDVKKRSYLVSIGDQEAKDKDLTSISLECFSAAIIMTKVKSLKPRTLILTSGTLPPLDDLETDFGIPFPIKLQNPHVFS